MHSGAAPRIAIVGLGPRGLGALEALAAILPDGADPWRVDVYDPSAAPGAGPNFDPDESDVCHLNIPVRDIHIRAAGAIAVPGFADWLPERPDPDSFPARTEIGRYLEARLAALEARPEMALARFCVAVDELRRDGDGWVLMAEGRAQGPYAEVLLALGQPEVKPDDQLAEWEAHAGRSAGVLAPAYPARSLCALAADWTGKTVAIRGLALSAFDVVRVLTLAQGGRFEAGRYRSSGREPRRILPFSLDGKPPFAKPETEALDRRFTPTAEETRRFEASMAKASAGSPDRAIELLDAALAPVVRRILDTEGAPFENGAVAAWLAQEWTAPGEQERGGPLDILRQGIEMAEGSRTPSIGYTLGQVWRKWQDEVRRGFNPVATPLATAERLIGFDEGLKRYSYGPPVSTSRELAALVDAGVVDLGLSADPEITLAQEGWRLGSGARQEVAEVMIDAVLPSPDPSRVSAALVKDLLSSGLTQLVAKGFGLRTRADATLIGPDGREQTGLCLLGRLALGSVIAVDSLHDCFGDASSRWARGVAERRLASGA